jgi:glutathione synthase/RimK-type ligase-like ATP-grasp enzyme
VKILIVVHEMKDWSYDELAGVEVVEARTYLTDPSYSDMSRARVFNLCRSYRYQSEGYYITLLAEARGHRPLPGLSTIRDSQMQSLIRLASEDMDERIQRTLAPIKSKRFTLSIYFGQNVAVRHRSLSNHLFNQFHAPLLRAHFEQVRGRWFLDDIDLIALNDVPVSHRSFVARAAAEYFSGRRPTPRPKVKARFYMAILHDPVAVDRASNPSALRLFVKAAARHGISAELITRSRFNRLPEYDALFIRETTSVTNHTFRFARRAQAEDMVVIDDPVSILKCSNKVFLQEALERRDIRTPRTLVLHRDNWQRAGTELGYPVILKEPDSSFSLGVKKCESPEELDQQCQKMLVRSELILAQEFVPTPFDWRIGVIDGQALYACRYYMARRHWQIVLRESDGRRVEGNVDTLPIEEAPPIVVKTALRATRAIGDGLYGVDLKLIGKTCYVIEVNDNPSIDHGIEDAYLGASLYDRIMYVFRSRLDRKAEAAQPRG